MRTSFYFERATVRLVSFIDTKTFKPLNEGRVRLKVVLLSGLLQHLNAHEDVKFAPLLAKIDEPRFGVVLHFIQHGQVFQIDAKIRHSALNDALLQLIIHKISPIRINAPQSNEFVRLPS